MTLVCDRNFENQGWVPKQGIALGRKCAIIVHVLQTSRPVPKLVMHVAA